MIKNQKIHDSFPFKKKNIGWWVFYGYGDNYEQHVMGHHVKYSELGKDPVFEGFDFCGLTVKMTPSEQRQAYIWFMLDPVRAAKYCWIQILSTWDKSQMMLEIVGRTIALLCMIFLPSLLGYQRE